MSKENSESQSGIALAMVAVSSDRLPDIAKLQAACGAPSARLGGILKSLFGRKKPPAEDCAWKDGILVFENGDMLISVALMPAPIPWSSLEGPCATAWWWPEAAERMQSHKFHFLLSIIGGLLEPVERRLLLTRLACAVLRETDAVGVYWGDGTLVHEPKFFLEAAKSAGPKDIPAIIWIDVRVEPNSDGTSRCFTTGMAPLGFLEIEVERSSLPPEELFGFIGDTACYIVNNRLPIKDGETMGRTAEEKFKVLYGPSMFDRSTVMQLIMS
jgi:hypothetical protein